MASQKALWRPSTDSASKLQSRKFQATTDSKVKTPFASRTFAPGRKAFSGNRTPIVQPYSSFADPHLTSYFTKKFEGAKVVQSNASPYFANLSSTLKKTHVSTGKVKAMLCKSSQVSAVNQVHGKSSSKEPPATYSVTVTTGAKKDASTNARVFLTLLGTHGKLSKRRLCSSCLEDGSVQQGDSGKENFLFTGGESKVFLLTGPYVGEPTNLIVEHDGLSKEHSWFLEKIDVIHISTRRQWRFSCGMWLSLFQTDCQLTRQLRPDHAVTAHASTSLTPTALVQRQQSRKTEWNVYDITVVTGDVRGAGTDANVFIAVSGENGITPMTQLINGNDGNFTRGKTAVFRMNASHLGQLSSCVLEHDNTGFGPDWFLEKVEITDSGVEGAELNEATRYTFPCSKWLSKDVGNGKIQRTLIPRSNLDSDDPVEYTSLGVCPSAERCKYIIVTRTGDCKGAGIDARVMITIFGERGDSGPLVLDNGEANFSRNRVDQFLIQCPALGDIDRVFIGHDNSGVCSSWFLDGVEIQDLAGRLMYRFPCHAWLDKESGNGEVSRVLDCAYSEVLKDADDGSPYTGSYGMAASKYRFHVMVWTGDQRLASTGASLMLVMSPNDQSSMTGETANGGPTERFSLSKETAIVSDHVMEVKNHPSGRSAVDCFLLEACHHHNPLTSISIGWDNKGLCGSWFLEKIAIQDLTTGTSYHFRCNMRLDGGEEDERTHHLLTPLSQADQAPVQDSSLSDVKWSVCVWTSDILDAGTDADVFLQLFGEKGMSKAVQLDNGVDNFERGEMDKFQVSFEDVGQPQKLCIQHDNSNEFADWHLQKVCMVNCLTGEKYNFPCNQWLSQDRGHGLACELPAQP